MTFGNSRTGLHSTVGVFEKHKRNRCCLYKPQQPQLKVSFSHCLFLLRSLAISVQSLNMDNQNQFPSAPSKYDCLLFDLDDTLYPLSSGIAAACRKNIEEFMLQKLGIELSKVPDMASLLYKLYGTTMAGLRAIGYDFDYDEYHSFVHGRLPYQYLKPDPVLRGLLLSLPFRKVIFTNGDRVHAAKVLSRLGLEDCLEGIICFETLNSKKKSTQDVSMGGDEKPDVPVTKLYDIMEHFSKSNADSELPATPVVCKPFEAAIEEALKIADINPRRTLFFDDSVRNIQSGKRVGLTTVLVGTSHKVQGADFALESIHNIREALPELWEDGKKSENVVYSESVAIETFVEA